VAYSVENAVFQWEEGGRRLREAPDRDRPRLDRDVDAIVDELRRRLGSSFTIEELADLYATDPDWARELAAGQVAASDATSIVDAAFERYAREASNFAGGRPRPRAGSGRA
jgi:hypothetical protein